MCCHRLSGHVLGPGGTSTHKEDQGESCFGGQCCAFRYAQCTPLLGVPLLRGEGLRFYSAHSALSCNRPIHPCNLPDGSVFPVQVSLCMGQVRGKFLFSVFVRDNTVEKLQKKLLEEEKQHSEVFLPHHSFQERRMDCLCNHPPRPPLKATFTCLPDLVAEHSSSKYRHASQEWRASYR